MRGTISPLLHYVFTAWYLVKHGDNFTFINISQIAVHFWSRGSSVSVLTELRTGRLGFDSRQGWNVLPSPPHPDRFWGLPSLPLSGYRW
jgi:hypothetical protein